MCVCFFVRFGSPRFHLVSIQLNAFVELTMMSWPLLFQFKWLGFSNRWHCVWMDENTHQIYLNRFYLPKLFEACLSGADLYDAVCRCLFWILLYITAVDGHCSANTWCIIRLHLLRSTSKCRHFSFDLHAHTHTHTKLLCPNNNKCMRYHANIHILIQMDCR